MKCSCSPHSKIIRRGRVINEEWLLLKKGYNAKYNGTELISSPSCKKCGRDISLLELEKLGMKHLMARRSQGTGTNFYNAYARRAAAYHEFSEAEDREGVILKEILKFCTKSAEILDIGCGTGKFARLIAPSLHHVWALDSSPHLLTHCKKLNSHYDNISCLLAGAEKIPLLDSSVDIIMMTWATFHVIEAFPEMLRVLRKGGTIIRIGARTQDELTKLFPGSKATSFSPTNTWFESQGFKTKNLEILVTFKNAKAAQKILRIVIDPKISCKQERFNHKIAFQVFKKT